MQDTNDAAQGGSRREAIQGLVEEFYEKKTQELEAVKEAARPRRSRGPQVLAALAAVCLIAAIVAARMFPPEKPSISEDQFDQGARVSIFLASLNIEKYQRSAGRLPNTLIAAGIDDTTITFEPKSNNSYQLSMKVGSRLVQYNSAEDVRKFVGSAYNRLRGH